MQSFLNNPGLGSAGAIVGGMVACAVLLVLLYRWASRHERLLRRLWTDWLALPQVRKLQGRFAPQLAFVRARLTPGGYLGLELTIGALLLLGSVWVFGGIAKGVVTGAPLTEVDLQVAHWFHARAMSPVTQLMLAVSRLHDPVPVTGYVVVLALWLAWKRDWAWFTSVVVTIPSGALLNVLMKYAFQRTRPTFDEPLLSLSTYSFPSGHAAGSMLFYGVLAALLVARASRWNRRVGIVVAASAMVLLVSLSRVYLGVHYLSDVLAGVAEASAWLSLCLVGIHAYYRRRAAAASALPGPGGATSARASKSSGRSK